MGLSETIVIILGLLCATLVTLCYIFKDKM